MARAVKSAGEPAEQPKREATVPYTAVVYFHGMGSQRRYEETSNLVDQIDLYLNNRHRRGESLGLIRSIRARVEPLHEKLGQSGTIGYIRAKLIGEKLEDAQSIRFYEVYWAPIMAEQKSPLGVLWWIFSQPWRPWKTLRSPWRERQRLRRAALVALYESEQKAASQERREDYRELLLAYDDFEKLEQQRRFPGGSFDQFLAFVGEREPANPDAAIRRQALARRWQYAYQANKLRNAALLVTLALALVLLAGGVLLGILLTLQVLFGSEPLADLVQRLDLPFGADWKTATGIGIALAGLLGIGRFLTNYMGDVEAWATYEETDAKHIARNNVLDRSLDVLTHVLSDDTCKRVAVIAHSLGTSVAHDALLALSRRNRAYNPADPMSGQVDLAKLEHLVTMGSPIDKIEYFFESYVSNSHRYKRVVEDLRGDIGSAPFSHNHKPHMHWINFWDEGDPISGPLHSPAGSRDFIQRVDNVHIASYRFPAPSASHSGYFGHETVIDCLTRVIGHRASSFRTLPMPETGEDYDYESIYLGLGEPPGGRMPFIWMAVATPWLAVIGLAGWAFGSPHIAFTGSVLAATLFALLLIGRFASAAAGQRKPL